MYPNRSSILRGTWGVMAAVSMWAVPLMGTAVPAPHGSVELTADQAASLPGRPLLAGFHFQLESGWHIYWINPGDSGEPPRVKWDLPPGFAAGPLEWPTPQRIEDHSLIDYGYQNSVLLPVKITPPAAAKGGDEVQLRASVKWLVCRDICVPAHADVVLTLPARDVNSASASSRHALFAQASSNLPRPMPKSWRVSVKLQDRQWALRVETGRRETGATFLPLESNQIENAAPQVVHPTAHGLEIDLQKSDQLLKPPSQLKGVLVLASGQGYTVEAPVTAVP